MKLTLLEKLQDNNYALYFAIFTCIAIAPNSYYMFHEFSLIPLDFFAREIQAAAIAILLAGSILYYTAKKNLDYASKFAYFEFFISCCYYFHSLIMKDGHMVWNWHIIPAIAFAYMLPWSVKGYAGSIDYDQIPKRGGKKESEPLTESLISSAPVALSDEQLAMIASMIAMKNQTIEPKQPEKPLSEIPTEELLKEAEAAKDDDLDNIFEKGAQISAIK